MIYLGRKNTLQKQPFSKSVGFLFVCYWTILVAWQNISGVSARTNVDLIIKFGLLVWFVLFYIMRLKTLSPKIFFVFLLGTALLVPAICKESISFSMIISYVYPLLFITMVYGVGDQFIITKQHLLIFCNWIIVITLYSSIYALIFCWEQFSGALQLSNAYGNELSSFFVSNHEYGMYLLAAVVSCLLCLQLSPPQTRLKTFYIVALGLFGINLILTFSRTALFALAIILIIFAVLGRGSMRRWIICLFIVGLTALLLIPQLSDYFYRIILKENHLSGRDVLYDYAIAYYSQGTLTDKIFGHGISQTNRFLRTITTLKSFHNAYFQVLITFGAVGLGALLLFLTTQIIASVRFIKQDRFLGSLFLGLIVSASAMMFTNTAIVFTSPIDSYFLTIFMFVVPKYIRNAINKGIFEESEG